MCHICGDIFEAASPGLRERCASSSFFVPSFLTTRTAERFDKRQWEESWENTKRLLCRRASNLQLELDADIYGRGA